MGGFPKGNGRVAVIHLVVKACDFAMCWLCHDTAPFDASSSAMSPSQMLRNLSPNFGQEKRDACARQAPAFGAGALQDEAESRAPPARRNSQV